MQGDAPVEGRRGNLGAQRGLVIPYRELTTDVAVDHAEDAAGFEMDGQEQVAVKLRARTVAALPLQANAGALGHARGMVTSSLHDAPG